MYRRAWIAAVVLLALSLAVPAARQAPAQPDYATLGLALERAARRPFAHYVQERIVSALGITQTAFELTPAMRPYVARGLAARARKNRGGGNKDVHRGGRGPIMDS